MKKRRRISLIMAILFVFSIGLAACSKSEGPKTNEDGTSKGDVKYGGVYESYIGSDFNTLDPAFATASMDGSMVSLLYDSLVRFDEEGKVIASLAKSWETPDDKTIIFHLVNNAKFHNGNKFTSKDVKYSFERVLDPNVGSPRTWVFEKVEGAKEFMEGSAKEVAGIEIPDDSTVKITLVQPFAPFLSMMGMPAAHIVDKTEIEKYSDQKDYALKPVGTGPFIFEEYSEGDIFKVKANKDYFSGRPYIDGINYRVIKDNSTAVAEFEAGNLDCLSIPSADLQRFLNNPEYKDRIMNNNTFWNYYIGMMYNKSPFDDKRVRQAFIYAIDREAIINVARKDAAVISNGPIPPGLDGYRDDLNPYPYNLDKAKELLKEAGYSEENPCKIQLWHADSASNVALLEPIQAMLNKAGFQVKLVSMEWNSYREAVRAGKADAFYLSWGADYPDAENYLYPLFHSKMTNGGGNETYYNNPEVDKLLEKAHATVDYEDRIKLYHDIEDMVIEDAARTWLYLSVNWSIYKPEVKGVKVYRIFNADKGLDMWLDR